MHHAMYKALSTHDDLAQLSACTVILNGLFGSLLKHRPVIF